MMALLDIRHLTTQIPTPRGTLTVVDDVSFTVDAGECFGLVGESGSGKSMTIKSILGLIPPPGRVTGGAVLHDGQDLTLLSPRAMNAIRGRGIATIVQHSGARDADRRLSAPVVRRHVPARCDCGGPVLQSGANPCGRTDHRA